MGATSLLPMAAGLEADRVFVEIRRKLRFIPPDTGSESPALGTPHSSIDSTPGGGRGIAAEASLGVFRIRASAAAPSSAVCMECACLEHLTEGWVGMSRPFQDVHALSLPISVVEAKTGVPIGNNRNASLCSSAMEVAFAAFFPQNANRASLQGWNLVGDPLVRRTSLLFFRQSREVKRVG